MNRKLTQRFIREPLTNYGQCKTAPGFTLIELLAVMVIILIIAGFFVGVSGPAGQSAKKRKAEVMISALEVAICMYHADTGEYPGDASLSAMINALKTNPGAPVVGWGGPYMEFKREDYQSKDPTTNIILDPWGIAYSYDAAPAKGNTNSFNLWSWGPDKTNDSSDPDTLPDDDIRNW